MNKEEKSKSFFSNLFRKKSKEDNIEDTEEIDLDKLN